MTKAKTNFLQTTVIYKQQQGGEKELVITNIQIKGDISFVKLEEGEHLIEMTEDDLINFDIRVGDTLKFQGEKFQGVDITARPLDAVPYKRKK